MLFKTDTKEKFHAITPVAAHISGSMTEEMRDVLIGFLQNDGNDAGSHPRSVVLNLSGVDLIDEAPAEALVAIQQKFYEENASFVICGLQPAVEDYLDKAELLELMNVTPTESEAWDIVQMEEIERELLDDDDVRLT